MDMMNHIEKTLQRIDDIELSDPDPVQEAYTIKLLIDSMNPDYAMFSALIERYGSSASRAVAGALATCFAVDSYRNQPSASLEQVLRLATVSSLSYPNFLQLCLAAIRGYIAKESDLKEDLLSGQSLRLFLLRCLTYEGEGQYVVLDSIISVLADLCFRNLLGQVFLPRILLVFNKASFPKGRISMDYSERKSMSFSDNLRLLLDSNMGAMRRGLRSQSSSG
jgi:hypothetical protein